jgi:phosphoenolpyruvate-protein phosphotransferase
METYQAIGISSGIAIGPIYRHDTQIITVEPCNCIDPDIEAKRLNAALKEAQKQLEDILEQTKKVAGSKEAEIFGAHIVLLSDPELLKKVYDFIQNDHYSAEFAWYQGTEYYAEMLSSLDDSYLRERCVDVRDVAQRVLRILQGKSLPGSKMLDYPAIVVAEDLTPSDTVAFDKTKVLAFCTAKGGATSHVAILSKAIGIPAVVGVGPILDKLAQNRLAIVNGESGEIFLDPDKPTVVHYTEMAERLKQSFEEALVYAKQPATSADHRQFEVVANIGSPADAAKAIEFGAEGVGLLRTEFLFLNREAEPDEDEQYSVYRKILEHFGKNPVVIRTMDIGGDKPASYLNMAQELNPFLGVRGVRLSLARPKVFQTQLRALLRAGVGYNLKIMFPMVGLLKEVQQIKMHVQEARQSLEKQGINYNKDVEVGIMVEIPSAAIMADVLAKEVDFFSIGTNDLSQYTMASDRTNADVSPMADALDPAVLRLIQMVIKAAHENGKWVGLCGELAGDPLATPVLMGLEVDEFSMNPRSIPYVKQAIRRFVMPQAAEIAEKALTLPSAAAVRKYLQAFR